MAGHRLVQACLRLVARFRPDASSAYSAHATHHLLRNETLENPALETNNPTSPHHLPHNFANFLSARLLPLASPLHHTHHQQQAILAAILCLLICTLFLCINVNKDNKKPLWDTRDRELVRRIQVLKQQLATTEKRAADSTREAAQCREILERRAGLLASLLLPSEDEMEQELHQRKLAEMASLMLDLLNWKLGQGSPLPRSHFWRAYTICESMIHQLTPSLSVANACVSQLQRLLLEFELYRTGVPLQWRWRAMEGSSGSQRVFCDSYDKLRLRGERPGYDADDSSPIGTNHSWSLRLNREIPLDQWLTGAIPAGAPDSFILPYALRPEAEQVLEEARRRLNRSENQGASMRGIPVEEVEHARDQASAMLMRYAASPDLQPKIQAWLETTRSAARPPTLRISLAEWVDGSDLTDHGTTPLGALARRVVAASSAEEPGAVSNKFNDEEEPPSSSRVMTSETLNPPAPGRGRQTRYWTLPVGGSLRWLNDLSHDVEVRVGGIAARCICVGESLELFMHTVGTGRYEWRVKSGYEQGQGGPGAWSHAFAAEVHVVLVDEITQFGTFSDESCDTEKCMNDVGASNAASPHSVYNEGVDDDHQPNKQLKAIESSEPTSPNFFEAAAAHENALAMYTSMTVAASTFAGFARGEIGAVTDHASALSRIPRLEELAGAVDKAADRLIRETDCSDQAQALVVSIRRLPAARGARRDACAEAASQVCRGTARAVALAAALEAYASVLLVSVTRGALCGPQPRARDQLRKLRSPQIDAVCTVLLDASEKARLPDTAQSLAAAAARLRDSSDALGYLKRLLPPETRAMKLRPNETPDKESVVKESQPPAPKTPPTIPGIKRADDALSGCESLSTDVIDSKIEEQRRELNNAREALQERRRSRTYTRHIGVGEADNATTASLNLGLVHKSEEETSTEQDMFSSENNP